MDSERKEIRHGWEGGRESSRSILRKEERNGREKSRYCQFRYHAFISTPPNVVSIEFSPSRAKMGEEENEFSSLSAEFPPPPPSPHPQRFANALCYGNTRVRRGSRADLSRAARAEKNYRKILIRLTKGISLRLEKRR